MAELMLRHLVFCQLNLGKILMMRLYSGTTCPYSHRCRIVLYEKGMDFEVIDVDLMNKAEDVAIINPYNRVPVLVERDLVLYEANIINEYIDERFPHPQLMPPDPVMRGRARLFLHRFEQELYSNVDIIEQNGKTADKARAAIRDNLTQVSQILVKQKYLLGEEFSMLDVAIAPLLWRLDRYGIQLGKEAAPLMKYAERMFSRQGFIDALTPSERAMRK
jgi:RNA polymerase-associated protein